MKQFKGCTSTTRQQNQKREASSLQLLKVSESDSAVTESATNLRYTCVRVLKDLNSGGGSLTRLLPEAQKRVARTEQAQLQAWCYGLCRWSPQLGALVDQLLDKPMKVRDQDVYLLLQLGVFQLMHTGVAEHAAVDETVKVTKRLKKKWATSLVNAVLRSFIRRKSELEAALDEAAHYAHPRWLLDRLRADWPDQWESICNENNSQGPMTLRVNSARGTVVQYADRLAAAGLSCVVSPIAPDALTLDAPTDVLALPGFVEGDVSVQDAAAQLAACKLIELSPAGGKLLDACAAPGGKTAHALEKSHFSSVLALDKDQDRVDRMAQTFRRLGLEDTVVYTTCDALDTDQWWDRQGFSAILLDAPCSGTGVIRRHPDIKLLRRETDIKSLVKHQSDLLHTLWQTLLPGGTMLYATCSVLRSENQHQVEHFLSRTADAQLLGDMIQILPGENRMDGFFYAALTKLSL